MQIFRLYAFQILHECVNSPQSIHDNRINAD